MSDTIQSNSDIPKTNLQQKVALVDLPIFRSIGTTIILILVLWVSNSVKIFPAIVFSTVSLIAIAITSFFSTWTVFLIMKEQKITKTDHLNKDNLSDNFTILQIKILGLLALFVGYIAWFTLIQNEFAPPDAMERDVAVVAFRKTGPAVWFSPLLGSIGFAASLLWSTRKIRNIVTDLPSNPDSGGAREQILPIVNISNIKPIRNSEKNENVQIQFKFNDKSFVSKIKINPDIIKVEFSNPMENDAFEKLMTQIAWRIINEPQNAFSAYATIEHDDARKLRCTLDLTSLNDSLKIELNPIDGVEFWPKII
ncbi:MAG: hypothetical protein WCJ72_15480 [Chryseobacterium sp.]